MEFELYNKIRNAILEVIIPLWKALLHTLLIKLN